MSVKSEHTMAPVIKNEPAAEDQATLAILTSSATIRRMHSPASEGEAEFTDDEMSVDDDEGGDTGRDDEDSPDYWTTRLECDEDDVHEITMLSIEESRKQVALEELRDMIDEHMGEPERIFYIFDMVVDHISDHFGRPEMVPVDIERFKEQFFTLVVLFVKVTYNDMSVDGEGKDTTPLLLSDAVKNDLDRLQKSWFPSDLAKTCLAMLQPQSESDTHLAKQTASQFYDMILHELIAYDGNGRDHHLALKTTMAEQARKLADLLDDEVAGSEDDVLPHPEQLPNAQTETTPKSNDMLEQSQDVQTKLKEEIRILKEQNEQKDANIAELHLRIEAIHTLLSNDTA